jgi:glycosyltransferase involved in cell wall biosynthesis
MAKICLNMIVKNESKIITRLFDTLLSIIDCWIISDTGSTDNTPEIIKDYFEEKKLPGELHHHTWKNFGHNRALALKCAQDSSIEFDYVLFLDADMKLVIKSSFNKKKLVHDVYTIKQGSSTLSYYNVRMMKKKLNSTCVGVTHEHYDIKGDFSQVAMDDLFIDDIGDGGAKHDKYERDIRLLKAGIEEEPNNCRYYFYLARSYECVKESDNAIEYYKKRIEKGGWSEEIYFSYYCIGNIYNFHLNEKEKAISNYLMAYNVNPQRIESIYKIIEMYRKDAKHQLANKFIKWAEETLKQPLNDRNILFMEPQIYKYMIDYEKSIIAYYTGEHDEGLKVSNKLLLNSKIIGIDDGKYNLTKSNIKFYLKNLEKLGGNHIKNFAVDDLKKDQLNLDNIENFNDYKNMLNPCINYIPGHGMFINLRCVNYKVTNSNNRNPEYQVYKNEELVDTNNENPVKTINFLCKLDKEYNINNNSLLNFDEKVFDHKFCVKGIEDVRIINHNKNIYLVGNSREVSQDRLPKMTLSKYSIQNKQVESTVLLHGYEDHKCQKNWSPFIHKDKLLFVYSFSPLVILSFNLETGKCSVYKKQEYQQNYDHFRGGSPGFYINNDLYFIIHEVSMDGGRKYYHRFVKFNKNLEIEKVSCLFYFRNWGIEYVAGAVHEQKNNRILISWGEADDTANLSYISQDNLKKFMDFD